MKKLAQIWSAMVYQNIVIIIVVGVIRELFGNYGWWYNQEILNIVNPAYHIILPILISHTGGRIIGGQRGAVVASIVTFGLTLSSTVPAIMGAMIIGPLTGWIIKKLDQMIKKKLPGVGYELLISNVLASVVAIALTLISYHYIGEILSVGVERATDILASIINSHWLPLAAVIIEPAKVVFLNNIINFGFLSPLGIQQANELGKSILFLLEANPGPGLGVLLAYWMKTKGEQRKGAKLATYIHFLGGIHEVYFPYVLKNPRLIISLALGGMAGIYVFQWFKVGLVAVSSPGSIFLIVGLAPRNDMLYVVLAVLISALISFGLSLILIKSVSNSPTVSENENTIIEFYQIDKEDVLSETKQNEEIHSIKSVEGRNAFNDKKIKTIYFVCEAGIGSSAMGASMLRKKLEQTSHNITVENASIDEIPAYADLVICHQKLLQTVQKEFPKKSIYPLPTFTDMKEYDHLVNKLIGT